MTVNIFLRTAFLTFSALAAAKEMPKDDFKAAELYDSGIRHANNVALKKVSCTPWFPHRPHPLRANTDYRKLGPGRRLLALTIQLSTQRSRTRSNVLTGLPFPGMTSSDAAT
jgi:hypothetical protein